MNMGLMLMTVALFVPSSGDWHGDPTDSGFSHQIENGFDSSVSLRSMFQCKTKCNCLCKPTDDGFLFNCDSVLYAESWYSDLRSPKFNLYISCSDNVSRGDLMQPFHDLSEYLLRHPTLLRLVGCPIESVSAIRNAANVAVFYFNCGKKNISSLDPDLLSDFRNMQGFLLECASLKILPDAIFEAAENTLARIRIKDTMIERLGGSLSTLSNLKSLHLIGNKKLRLLTKKDLSGLYSLESLKIEKSPLLKIDEELFDAIQNISKLTISEVGWRHLPRSFKILEKLEKLDISRTSLKSLGSDMFGHNLRLHRVRIVGNRLLDVHPNCIPLLNNSEYIDLSRNRISNLPNQTIRFDNLIVFILNGNGQDLMSVENFIESRSILKFEMTDSKVHEIHRDFFLETPEIEHIDLSDNEIRHLSDAFFGKNEKLESVYLKGNQLTFVPISLFEGKRQLEILDISFNSISKFNVDISQDLVLLNQFNSFNNKLNFIPGIPFSRMPNITLLDLSNNNISTIEASALEGMQKLETLNIGGNKLNGKFFPFELKSDKLIEIYAENNYFTEISWLNIRSLEYLNLSQNRIHSLNLDIRCENLQTLDLSQNNISDHPRVLSVDSFPRLSWLDLSFNCMKSLDTFDEWPKLKLDFFDLSGNQMKAFPWQFLNRFYTARTFIMIHSAMSDVRPRDLPWLPQVFILDLSHNQISSERWTWFFDEQLKSAGKLSPFRHLGNLEELYLSHNRITDIPIDIRTRNPKLRILDLRYNKIKFLSYHEVLFSPYNFDEFGNATPYDVCQKLTVDLRNNLIRRIQLPHSMLIRNLTSICDKHRYSHATILLGFNPFECGCDVIPFLRVVEEDVVLFSELWRTEKKDWLLPARINTDNLTCRYPEYVRGKLVTATETYMHHLMLTMGYCYLSEDKDFIGHK